MDHQMTGGAGGGCFVAGGADVNIAAWRMGCILRRYRPIAPKPAAATQAPPLALMAVAAAASATTGRRRTRKDGKVRSRKRGLLADDNHSSDKCNASSASGSGGSCDSPAALLPLFPDSPDPLPAPPAPAKKLQVVNHAGKPAVVRRPAPPPAWMTVESVTETWSNDADDAGAAASEDDPLFMTDMRGRVTWVNEACRRLIGGGDGGEPKVVWVKKEARMPAWGTCAGFTCRVRARSSLSAPVAAPCDVRRVDGVGYAWRLDVRAALCLTSIA